MTEQKAAEMTATKDDTAPRIHHWNYRMFTRLAPIADTGDYDEEHFIGEAYYDADDNLIAWSADPMSAFGDSPEALIADLNRMIEAVGKEPLAVEELGKPRPPVEWSVAYECDNGHAYSTDLCDRCASTLVDGRQRCATCFLPMVVKRLATLPAHHNGTAP